MGHTTHRILAVQSNRPLMSAEESWHTAQVYMLSCVNTSGSSPRLLKIVSTTFLSFPQIEPQGSHLSQDFSLPSSCGENMTKNRWSFTGTLPELIVEMDGMAPWMTISGGFHFHAHFRESVCVCVLLLSGTVVI